jgi:hypothetical protein
MEPTRRVADGLERLKDIFRAAPDTRMTLHEASQSSGLDVCVCGHVLAALEDVRFLRRAGDGLYEFGGACEE